jgi:PAS domain S-box-containing protein
VGHDLFHRLPNPATPDCTTCENASYQEILQSLKNQHFLVNLTNYLNSTGNFTHRIHKILNILGKYTNADRIYIFEDYQQGKMTDNTYEWCRPGIKPEKEQYQQVTYMSHILDWKSHLIKDGVIHSLFIDALPDHTKKNLHSESTQSQLIFPIHVYNNFYGFIGFENKKPRIWNDMDVEFLKTVSVIIATAFEKSHSEEDIKNSEKKFRDIFNHSSDSIFIFNYRGEILEANNRACETLELPKDILVKKTIESIFPKDRVPHEKLYRTTRQQDIEIFESEFSLHNGKLLSVEINSRPIIFNNQKAILCVVRDISGRKEIQREIVSAIIQAEEKERGRIARDLHDGLGPLLSSLKLYAKVLGTTADMEKREQMLKAVMEVLDESMILTKEILNNLSPHVLDDFGLASAIHSFCKKITIAKEIDIKFDSNIFDQRFETNVEIVLFRVLKELVNNTIKHALATRIDIFLLRTESTLSLVYSDNGIGFDVKKVLDNQSSGMGISNIVNRIRSVNGRLMFESQSEKGIQIKIEVELKPLVNPL